MKRDLFEEIKEGFDALAEQRQKDKQLKKAKKDTTERKKTNANQPK